MSHIPISNQLRTNSFNQFIVIPLDWWAVGYRVSTDGRKHQNVTSDTGKQAPYLSHTRMVQELAAIGLLNEPTSAHSGNHQ